MIFKFVIFFLFLTFNAYSADCEKPKMPSDDEWNIWLENIKKEALRIKDETILPPEIDKTILNTMKFIKRFRGTTLWTKSHAKIPAANHPPNTPDHVLFGLILGNTFGPPIKRPIKYPAMSVSTTMPINQVA